MKDRGLTGKRNQLPFICPDHPNSKIRKEWDETHYVFNGYPAGLGVESNVQFFCDTCGRELASEREG